MSLNVMSLEMLESLERENERAFIPLHNFKGVMHRPSLA